MRNFALRYLTTMIFALLTCSGCLAQGSISGKVCSKDGTAIVQATITLLAGKDSVVARTVTDSEGNYLLNNIHSGSYFVKASSTSYQSATKKVMLFNGMTMTVNFTLVSDAIQLDEVNVEGTGIIAHGDTTKYITRRFTTGQEQTLGDVLEALPGIKVDKTNNSVTANGKPVSRILVEKQDLFQGNNSVPLNNMPGQDVTSIDVIDNYSDYNILEGFKTSNETVISVNLDGKKKNRVSGKADLQAGIDNKYIVKDYTMLLKKKMMVSAIVSANNTGKALLNSKDVIGMNGGLSELLSGDDPQQKLMKTFADNAALIGDREDAYKRNNGIASLNTVFMPSKKVKVLWNSIFSLDHYRMNSDTRYSYLNVPLTYEISNQSRNRTTDVNSNLKLSFMPSKSFNIFYTGKVVYVHSSVDEQGRLVNPFTNDNGKHTIDLENNLLAIKKIGKKNTLNFSASYNYYRNRRREDFAADSAFYLGYRDLDDCFAYSHRMSSRHGGAEVFLLYRLNDNYYTRIGLSSYIDQENLLTRLDQQTANTAFDNDDYLRHENSGLDIQLRKDRGKLQFAAKGKISWLAFQTDISRSLTTMHRWVVLPSVDVKYNFNTFHFISFSYKDAVNTYGVEELFSHRVIDSYRMFYSSNVNRTFGYDHTLNLLHVLMKPLSGLTWINLVNFTCSADDILNDNLVNSIIRESSYRNISSGNNALTVATNINKKFRFFPLSLDASVSYNHSYVPYYIEDVLTRSKSNSWNLYGAVSTYQKKGFNFKLTGSYAVVDMHGGSHPYKVRNEGYSALLSYTHGKFYAEGKCRYRVVSLEEDKNENFYTDFTMRYDLTKKLSFTITGQDVFHLKNKTSDDAAVNNFMSTYSITRYMPGHILFGISIKY